MGLLWAAILLYWRTAGSGKSAIAIFGIVLTVVQAGLVCGPVPSWLTPASVAVSMLAFYFVTAGVAWRRERGRARAPSGRTGHCNNARTPE